MSTIELDQEGRALLEQLRQVTEDRKKLDDWEKHLRELLAERLLVGDQAVVDGRVVLEAQPNHRLSERKLIDLAGGALDDCWTRKLDLKKVRQIIPPLLLDQCYEPYDNPKKLILK